MTVFYNTDNLPLFKNAVLTIGTFDGVHKGHKAILQEVVDHASAVAGESVVVTFEPHPRKLLYPAQSLKLITPLEDKLTLLAATGISHVVVVPFTKEFAALSATEYIEQFLVRRFRPETIIIGYDHHFGHDRTGNITLLRKLAPVCNYDVVEIPAQLIEEAAVSSTKIRTALLEGNVEEAAHMMGRQYSLRGTVVRGAQIGRTIGYPTANIQPADFDQLIPANGIYAVRVRSNGQRYDGMLSIGFNPTVTEERKLKIEVNILDFEGDLYGQQLEIIFTQWMRSEEKFDSLEALKTQLAADERNARRILGGHTI